MTMRTQTITREQLVDLAMRMPQEKLSSWYEYGLFIQNHPIFTTVGEVADETEIDLQTELAAWEAASDEDWLDFEQQFAQSRQPRKKPTLMHKLRTIQIDGPADLATKVVI